MSLSTKVLEITSPTSTGNQSYTGVGFQPSAILFIATRSTTNSGSLANAEMMLGMAVSSSSRAVVVGQTPNAQAASVAGRRWDNTKCVIVIDNNNNAIVAADFVSMDSDGLTLNWTTANATTYKVYAFCLGGTDLTNVFIKELTTSASTGDQAITGVGFQPNCVIFMAPNTTTAAPAASGTWTQSFGMAVSSSSRGAVAVREANVTDPTNDEKAQSAAKMYIAANGSKGYNRTADFVSMDSDGFTINNSVASQSLMWALCLKGGQYKVGSFNQNTSDGSQAVSGVGFLPTGLLLTSFGAATTSSVIDGLEWSIGIANSSSSRASIWTGSLDNAATTATDQNNDVAKIIKTFTTVGGGSPTEDSAADLTSLDSDGFTLNWSNTDATAREILYLAMGSTAAGTAVKDVISSGVIPFAR